MEQTFPAGTAQTIKIGDASGDVVVHGWDQQTIKVTSAWKLGKMKQKENALVLGDCNSLEIWAPFETRIDIKDVSGSVAIEDVSQVSLRDVGGAVAASKIAGNVSIKDTGTRVALDDIRGSVTVSDIGLDLAVSQVGGDVKVVDIGGKAALLNISGNAVLNDVGIDATLKGIGGEVALSDVGSTCELQEIGGNVTVGDVGYNATLLYIKGNTQIGDIGGNAQIEGLGGSLSIGSVGGNLHLQSDFPVGSDSRVRVGGNGTLVLSESANISLRASAGGNIRGEVLSTIYPGSRINLVFGEGAARLDISVGGNLEIKAPIEPRSINTIDEWGRSEFSEEMAEFGREMKRFGRDLSREISSAFTDATSSIRNETLENIARSASERARRIAEAEAQRAQRIAEAQARKAARLNVRIHGREWRLDEQRIERLVEQARRAAAEGVQGALEAVEQALRNLSVTPPPPPPPPRPGAPPPPGTPPPGPFGAPGATPPPSWPAGVPPVPPAPGQFGGPQEAPPPEETPAEAQVGAAPEGQSEPEVNIEQEREAILRMIAEGRITPEEGDMLLEALGD